VCMREPYCWECVTLLGVGKGKNVLRSPVDSENVACQFVSSVLVFALPNPYLSLSFNFLSRSILYNENAGLPRRPN